MYTITEEAAEYPGGSSAMMKYLGGNIVYPSKARELAIGGKVFLKFIVNENGKIELIEVLKSSGYEEMDDEAIRVVKSMPLWKPAKMSGKSVKCYFNLPISFSLAEPYYTYNKASTNSEYRTMMNLVFEGKFDEVTLLLQKIEEPTDIDFLYNLAVFKFQTKNNQESCRLFQKAISTNNDKTGAYNNSVKFYKQYCN